MRKLVLLNIFLITLIRTHQNAHRCPPQIKDFGDSIPGHGGMTDRMYGTDKLLLLSSQILLPYVS